MRALALAVVLALALSGCVAEEPPAADPAPDPLPMPEPQAQTPLLFVPEPAPTLDNLTEFHWGLFEDAPALVLEVSVDFGDDNTCEVREGSARGPGPLGPGDLTLYETGWGLSWSSSSSGSLASAHHGDVDTRTDSSGSGASRGATWGSFEGPMTITFLGRNLESGNDFVGGASITFTIECENPFSITSARGGSVVLLANESNLAGGTGAETPEGSVNVQDAASQSFTAPVVRAAADGFGYQYASVTLEHPDGSEEWTWVPEAVVGLNEAQFFQGGPGDYTFTVDRAGAYVDAFWVAAWGLDGDVDLQANQLDKALIDSPFS